MVFTERGKIRRELSLPCGRCIGCRWTRARAWAIRCIHEAQCHDFNSFVTLTYDDDHLPGPSLVPEHLSAFVKRIRRAGNSVRFFGVGEYGEEGQRPHFHVLLFGKTFADREYIGKSLYRSPELERFWKFGTSTFGDVTYQSAGYCAKYSVKKVNGDLADEHYKRVNLSTGEIVSVVPEFGRMSLKPGIGFPWFDRFWKDVYHARDACVVNGQVLPAPRYYDILLGLRDPALSCDKDFDRYVNSKNFLEDCSPERLLVREVCAKAKLAFNTKRTL